MTGSLAIDHLNSLVILSGISGAGRSTALNKLEDHGFFIVDNLPVKLFGQFIEFTRQLPVERRKAGVSLNIDSQEKSVQSVIDLVNSIEEGRKRLSIIFLDCEDSIILKRYSETRRPHPRFDSNIHGTISDAIVKERAQLSSLKFIANIVVDTTSLTVHDLKREMERIVTHVLNEDIPQMRVNLVSFGFKYVAPRDCDLLFDVRFLPNPFFDLKLQLKTGLDSEVREFVLSSEDTRTFLNQVSALLLFLLPRYVREGKSYLTVGIGCTGGKHRSVSIVEALASRLSSECQSGYLLNCFHRDVALD
jgi:UPF0042 nucleotide-binding protein